LTLSHRTAKAKAVNPMRNNRFLTFSTWLCLGRKYIHCELIKEVLAHGQDRDRAPMSQWGISAREMAGSFRVDCKLEIDRRLRQPPINARGSAINHHCQVSNLQVYSQIITGHVERFLGEASHRAATRASFPTRLRCQLFAASSSLQVFPSVHSRMMSWQRAAQ
jgi:hypothetical protein